MDLLSEKDLTAALSRLPHWTVLDGRRLQRKFAFPDFAQAFSFMTLAAFHIEKINHHPEWTNVYNRLTVELTTHDAGGVTELDVELAQLLDRLSPKFQ